MSAKTNYMEWIEQCIENQHIKYYKYEKFNNIVKIGNGGFGQVYKVNKGKQNFALKSVNSLDNFTVKEIVSELKLHRDVDFHENIIRFYGITTKAESEHLKEYLLVLEYANGGTLRSYLEKEFSSLKWEDKYRLAHQLSSAVECLHEEGIVHRDLHSKNILMHNGSIKLADFGLGKRIDDTDDTATSASKIFGVIPYIDPVLFSNTRKKKSQSSEKKEITPQEIEKYKKSDVYSVGMLLWELSSGKRPYDEYEYDFDLAADIMRGAREAMVEGTPGEYYNLYSRCWDGEPDNRPTIQEVVTTLESTTSTNSNEVPRQEIYTESKKISTAPSTFDFIESFETYDNSSMVKQTSFDFIESFATSIVEELDSKVVKDLVDIFIKARNEGKSYSQYRLTFISYLSKHNFTFEELYEWLNKHCNEDDRFMLFLGYLYFSGNGTPINFFMAFQCFNKASSHPIAQFYLGICYEFGRGVKKDEKISFSWYEKSAKNSVAAMHSLGVYYENGVESIGIKKNEKLAFELYQEAADKGHVIAQLHLGNFYRIGNHFKQDDNKAFYYFNLSAQNEYPSGIIKLADCYLEGIGTRKDERKAFELYLKAANMNDLVAQYNVASCYENGLGVEKDLNKAKEWYQISAECEHDTPFERPTIDQAVKLEVMYQENLTEYLEDRNKELKTNNKGDQNHLDNPDYPMVNNVVDLKHDLSHLPLTNTIQVNKATNLLEAHFKSNGDRFNYGEFTERETVGEGSFGIVQSAIWKSRGLKIALKSLKADVALDEKAAREFVKELKHLQKVYYHPNINKFLGITKDDVRGSFIMVLQYADGGNLRSYLEQSFPSLAWSDKFNMAIDIVKGLTCLHAEQIIHRDLHDKNILVHQGRMMIADLGLSKDLDDSTLSSFSKTFGVPPFIEPQCFIDKMYRRDKRSDIYSLGNILWEISSGHTPFKSFSHYIIPSKILAGEREPPIEGTSSEYIELYEQCWDNDPKKRPIIQKVLDVLEQISYQYNINKVPLNAHKVIQDESTSQASNSNSTSLYDHDLCNLQI